MGLFGGGNSKSTTQNKDIVFNNVDYGGASGGQNVNIANEGDGNTFSMTDHGAINKSLDFAEVALDSVASLAQSSAASNASLAAQASKTGGEKDASSTIKLIFGVLGFSALIAFAFKKKG